MLVGCSQTIGAFEMVNLGTVEYLDYMQVDIEYPTEVNLTYLFSSIDQDALEMEKVIYIPPTNITRYLFTSAIYKPNYWEELDQEVFMFQDYDTGILYNVKIDMSGIKIPENPLISDYENMSNAYNQTFLELQVAIDNLTNMESQIENLLFNNSGLTISLAEVILENSNLTGLFQGQVNEISRLATELNISKADLLNMSSNVTTFKTFFEEMNSYKSSFNFRMAGSSEQYTTIYEYEITKKRLEDQVGGFPLLLIFAVIITTVLCFMIGYWKWAKRRASPEEIEMMEGVDPVVTKINRLKASLKIKPKNVKIKETIPVPVKTEEPDKYQEMETKINERIDGIESNIESKMDKNQDAILTQINELLSSKKTPAK